GAPRWASARVLVVAPDEVSVSTDDAEPEFTGATPAPADYRSDAAALPDGRPEPGWLAEVVAADAVAAELGRTLTGLGLPADAVRFGGDLRGDGERGGRDESGLRWRVLRRGGRWLAAAAGEPTSGLARAVFDDPGDAAAFAVGRVVLTGVGPRPSPVHRAAGPFTPVGDDPPLSLFRDLRVLVLGPGTALRRLGDDDGTVVHPAGTPLPALSLPPALAARPAHGLQVRRPVEVLVGTAVPWFGQPGGGTTVVLPEPVAALLAAGVLSAEVA
ncbi:TNT domain-containing protein, partial [Rhodococcus aerolatus]